MESLPLAFNLHVSLLKHLLTFLPDYYVGFDTSRLTAIYFCVASLDILDMIEGVDRDSIIEFLYSLQLSHPNSEDYRPMCGFIGSPYLGFCSCSAETPSAFASTAISKQFKQPHLAMTYSSLSVLLTLGDDLSKVNKKEILAGDNEHDLQCNQKFKTFVQHCRICSSPMVAFVPLKMEVNAIPAFCFVRAPFVPFLTTGRT